MSRWKGANQLASLYLTGVTVRKAESRAKQNHSQGGQTRLKTS